MTTPTAAIRALATVCFSFATLLLASNSFAGIVNSTGDIQDRTGTFVIGYQFTTGASPRTINALGVYDSGLDGLAEAHDVGIWLNTGGPALATVTVPAGAGSTLDDIFRYESISAITLAASTSYVIGAAFPSTADPFIDTDQVGLPAGPAYIADTGITFVQNRFLASGTLALPTSNGTGTLGRWAGGNATFFVPEPATFALATLSLLSLGFIGWRRRRR